nr:class II glutamine amidotransferase [Stygiolobus sp.]
MCRLLAFSVRGEINKEIINSFINAAKNDVYFKYGSHSHGWGITAIVWKREKPKVIYYKSVEPI